MNWTEGASGKMTPMCRYVEVNGDFYCMFKGRPWTTAWGNLRVEGRNFYGSLGSWPGVHAWLTGGTGGGE